MKKNIPNDFYKQAAEICDKLPDIPFPDIALVLFIRDQYLQKNFCLVDAITGKPVESLSDYIADEEPAEKIHRTYKGRKPYTRRERKHYVEAVVDGKEYTAKSKIILFAQLGIKEEYEKRQHTSVLPFINKSIVEIEYEFLKFTLEKYGSKLESYSAYDFDGQFKTIETKPEVANV